jgi:hypothetical protein
MKKVSVAAKQSKNFSDQKLKDRFGSRRSIEFVSSATYQCDDDGGRPARFSDCRLKP